MKIDELNKIRAELTYAAGDLRQRANDSYGCREAYLEKARRIETANAILGALSIKAIGEVTAALDL